MSREEKICKAVDDMWACCERVKEIGKCNADCPMHTTCLEDASFVEVADLLYEENVRNFIEYAEG